MHEQAILTACNRDGHSTLAKVNGNATAVAQLLALLISLVALSF